MDTQRIMDVDIAPKSPSGPAPSQDIKDSIPSSSAHSSNMPIVSASASSYVTNTNPLILEFNKIKHMLKSKKQYVKKFKSILKTISQSVKLYLSKKMIPMLKLNHKHKLQLDTVIRYIFDATKPYISSKLKKLLGKTFKPQMLND